MVKQQKTIALGIAAVCLIAAVTALAYNRNAATPTKEPIGEPIITYSTNEPEESKAKADTYAWQGTALEPKKIIITKLGVDAYVQKAGVDQNQQIAVPTNIHLAGWFHESVKPGERGLSIIAGHVSGITSDAVFTKLNLLTPGDQFSIELGNGKIQNYEVATTTSAPVTEAAGIIFSQDPSIESQLTLVTCDGNYEQSTESYDKRIIVISKLLKE